MSVTSLSISGVDADVLVHIFHHCLSPEGGTFLVKEAPWTLGQVCRYWRQVVLDTPLLWNSITIKDGPTTRNMSRACDIVAEVLRRAAASKLRITIEQSDPSTSTNSQPLYDLIQSRSEDLESLSLIMYGPVPRIVPSTAQLSSLRHFRINAQRKGHAGEGMLNQLIDTVARAPRIVPSTAQLSSLRHYRINAQRRDREGMLKQLIDTVARAPLLSFASFEGYFLTEKHLPTNAIQGVTWRSLRTLELHTYNKTQLIPMLSASSPQLQKLVLTSPGSAIPMAGDAIHLPRLETLELRHYLPEWWSRLTLPSLRTLKVVHLEMQMDVTPLFDMLHQWGTSLHSISFIDNVFMDITIGRLLRLTPAVTSLTVTGTLFPHIFDSLTADRSLLPHLTRLIVQCTETDDDKVNSPSLVSVLRAAESRVSTLEALEVEVIPRASETDAYEGLRGLFRRGISVQVKERNAAFAEWIEAPEFAMLLTGVFSFIEWFGSKPVIRNSDEVYHLLEYLVDILLDDENHLIPVIQKYDDASSLISTDAFPTDSVVGRKVRKLIERLDKRS